MGQSVEEVEHRASEALMIDVTGEFAPVCPDNVSSEAAKPSETKDTWR